MSNVANYFPSRYDFPDPNSADDEGVVCIGADLEPDTLLSAYAHGLFPWINDGDPIIWWSPNPRAVLLFEQFKISKSMKSFIRNHGYKVKLDTDFEAVINACQVVKRNREQGTWITEEVKKAYIRLHLLGYAHSFEVWEDDTLVGGLYGLSLGNAFFGESMFSYKSNTSKLAFYHLVGYCKRNDYEFIDCQVYNDHLGSMGVHKMKRARFLSMLELALKKETIIGKWKQI